MKRIIAFVSICFLLVFTSENINAVGVSAECACVMDMKTGRVIFEKNMKKSHTMASTTKIMTALVALENSKLDEIVTVSENAAGEEGTSLYLKKGQKISMEDLLYGLMLQSGNDAAIAIAENVAGTVEKFAEMMTKRAKEIGAENTSFKNPNGLDQEGHFTTAYDLALIAREAMKNETFAKISATKSKTISDGTQTVSNHNKMLKLYDGCIGVKTGFTKKSGRCLVTAAERNGIKVIAVTLNAPDDWSDHERMLNYAFETTEYFPIILSGMTINTITVKNGISNSVEVTAEKDVYISENKTDKFKNISVKCNVPNELSAPIKKGTVVGEIAVFYKDELFEVINLLTAVDVEYEEKKKITIFENFKKLLTYSLQSKKNIVK